MLIFFQDPLCGKRILRELESQVFATSRLQDTPEMKQGELKPGKALVFDRFCAKDTIARSAAA